MIVKLDRSQVRIAGLPAVESIDDLDSGESAEGAWSGFLEYQVVLDRAQVEWFKSLALPPTPGDDVPQERS